MASKTDYIKKLDEIAESYHQADVPDKFIEEACQEYTTSWIIEKLAGRSQVLELGYGDGIISRALVANKVPFEIVEGSPKVVATASETLPGVKITQALFEEFEPGVQYDAILALHVLEHVDEPVQILQRMAGWLTGDGVIIVIVPNKNSIHRQLAVKMGLQKALDTLSARDHVVGHQRVYSMETLKSDVEASGMTVMEEAGFFLKTLPNSMMLDYSEDLIQALNVISEELPADLLANIGMVIKQS